MNLFKRVQGALEQSAKPKDYNEAVLEQSNIWVRSISWGLITTTCFGVSWLYFAKTEEIIIAPGTLQPIGLVQEIQLPVGGYAKEILVKEGDKVQLGQVVMRLDAESSIQKSKSLQSSLNLKERQLSLKRVELERFKNINQDSVSTIEEKIVFETEILNRFKYLSEIGASAELQYLNQRNTLQDVKGRLRETRLNGLRQLAVYGQDIQRLKSEIARLDAEIVDNNVTLRYQELRSPVTGIVFDLKPKGPGYTARSTETVMKIVPLNALQAKVEIPSSDIGFVRTGMQVDVSIDSFPATDFGVLQGIIQQVGSDALPPDTAQNRQEYSYPAKIKLVSQHLELKNGIKLPLQPGMSLTANIKLRKVSYLMMLLGGFQDKANSLRHL